MSDSVTFLNRSHVLKEWAGYHPPAAPAARPGRSRACQAGREDLGPPRPAR